VFGDDRQALPLLRSVIRSTPKSPVAYEAYEWITHIYFRTGQYQKLMVNLEARWAAFPEKPERKKEQAAFAGFRGLPNQESERPHTALLHHGSPICLYPSR
jgi:hypothetical protein